ncbi:putative transporter small subunit [Salinibacterium sp. UTAS2018]|nr:putative transporter small subunit [Salinibacterium sp. UTAS2018]
MEIVIAIYMLVWPIVVAGVLFVLVRGFVKDWREARAEGRSII